MPRFDDADRERRGTQTSGQLTQQDPADMLWKYLQTSKPSPWTNSSGQQLDPQTMAPIAQPMADPLPPGPWSVDVLAQGDAQARQALSGGGAPAPWELPAAPRVPVVPAGVPAPVRSQSQGAATPAKPAGPSAAKQAAIEGGNADLAAARAQRESDAANAMDEISAIRDGELKRQVAEAESGKVLADYQKGVDDLAKQVPDRNRWWSTRTTGQRFAAVVSSALNTINQNMFGGGTAEDPIARFVNQDVEHQREEGNAKRARVDAQPGIYKMLRDRGLSDAAATTGAKLEMIRAAKGIVSDQLAGAKDAQIIANGKAALASLDRAEQEHAAKMQGHADQHGLAQAEIAGKWQTIQQNKDAAEARKRAVASGQLLPEERERAIFTRDGAPIVLADKADAARLKPVVASAESTKRLIREAKDLLRQWGSSSKWLNPKAAGEYKGRMETIVKNINQSEGIGNALQKSQVELYLESLGNDFTTPKSNTAAVLDSLDSAIGDSVDSHLVTAGGRPMFGSAPPSARPGVLK